jgi:hypothetical protein
MICKKNANGNRENTLVEETNLVLKKDFGVETHFYFIKENFEALGTIFPNKNPQGFKGSI